MHLKRRDARVETPDRSQCADGPYFFVANPINRSGISPRQNLKPNRDGSIDIYIQNNSPGADKIELAACSRRKILSDAAHVLAQ